MAIDVQTPESPGWWLKRCSDKLETRRKRINPLYERYEGRKAMPSELRSAPEPAQRFYRTARTNFEEMIVKAVRYRLQVIGILTGADSSEVGDVDAFGLWRTSGMHNEQHDVHRNMLVAGDGYVMCAKYEGEAAATAEDPRQVVTIHDPVRQSVIRAAAKFFHDPDLERDFAYLFLPEKRGDGGRRWVAVRKRKSSAGGVPRFGANSWEWSEGHGGEEGEPLPVRMPIVRYRNDEGVGEFERHLDILDRIDHLVLQGMVIATLQAFKQRAIKVNPKHMPDKDEQGRDIDYAAVFLADPGALWKLPESAEMWESNAVDLTPITTMATKEIERLSAVTFTPLSMFTPEAANQSATGASLVREGLTTKVQDKQARAGESHVQTIALLGQIAGSESLRDVRSIRVRWAPAERFSLAEKADAGPKAKASGMPWRTIMREVWQMEPEDIERMETERGDDLAFEALAAAAAAAPGAAQAPAPSAAPAPDAGGAAPAEA